MKKTALIAVCLCGMLSACEKDIKYVDTLPQLEIVVLDEMGAVLNGVDVELFGTEDDWNSGENMVAGSVTGTDGSVLFTELDEQVYFFFAEKNGMDNSQGIAYFEHPLKVNEIKVIQTTIK